MMLDLEKQDEKVIDHLAIVQAEVEAFLEVRGGHITSRGAPLLLCLSINFQTIHAPILQQIMLK